MLVRGIMASPKKRKGIPWSGVEECAVMCEVLFGFSAPFIERCRYVPVLEFEGGFFDRSGEEECEATVKHTTDFGILCRSQSK